MNPGTEDAQNIKDKASDADIEGGNSASNQTSSKVEGCNTSEYTAQTGSDECSFDVFAKLPPIKQLLVSAQEKQPQTKMFEVPEILEFSNRPDLDMAAGPALDVSSDGLDFLLKKVTELQKRL